MLHSRVARVLTFPLVAFGLFVANPFVLYFTGLYRLTLRARAGCTSWSTRTSSSTGCLFFWPLLGLDPLPGRWPYPARALLMVLSVPFHTVLGLTIMQSTHAARRRLVPVLGLTWADPWADQEVAGGILWAGGEMVSVTMLARAGRAVDPAVRAGGAPDRPRSWTGPRPRRAAEPRRQAAGGTPGAARAIAACGTISGQLRA